MNDEVSNCNASKGWRSRGYLPHFDSPDLYQAVTFRLFDSLPQSVLRKLQETSSSEVPPERRWSYERKKIEQWLDSGAGQCFLARQDVATIVEDALLFFDGNRYQLHSWVIMPNHIHLLLSMKRGYGMPAVLGSVKSFSAKQCNKLLGRTGTFWHREYYDRFIRDSEHFYNVVSYIENNPVKARLCFSKEEFRFGSAWKGRT